MPVLALRLPTATGSGTRTGRTAPLTRRSAGGGSSGSRRPRKIPQFPQKKPPSPPPATPFQPGSSPAPLLNPLQLAGLGLLTLAQAVWNALNYRTTVVTSPPVPGDTFYFGPGTNVNFTLQYFQGTKNNGSQSCSPPYTSYPGTPLTGALSISVQNGVGLRVGVASGSQTWNCGGSGTVHIDQDPYLWLKRADGTESVIAGQFRITNYYGQVSAYTIQNIRKDLQVTYNGVTQVLGGKTTPQVGAGMIPAAKDPAPASAPSPSPGPVAQPVPAILPAAVPGSSPTPVPAAVPGGLPAGQPVTLPAPNTAPIQRPTIQRSTPGSQAQTITATGVSQASAAPIVPTTPAEAVLIGTQLVGGPGSSPPATAVGTAAELGRLERKSELSLSKLDQLAPLLESLDILTALGEWLLSANEGVTYTLQPPCGTDASGDPLPPVEVVVPPTIGVEVATIARLDALAMLIDEHKQMRQPICKGKPTGSPVTVTAVEVE